MNTPCGFGSSNTVESRSASKLRTYVDENRLCLISLRDPVDKPVNRYFSGVLVSRNSSDQLSHADRLATADLPAKR